MSRDGLARRQQLNMRVPEATHTKLRAIAGANGRSITREVEHLIDQAADQHERLGGAAARRAANAMASSFLIEDSSAPERECRPSSGSKTEPRSSTQSPAPSMRWRVRCHAWAMTLPFVSSPRPSTAASRRAPRSGGRNERRRAHPAALTRVMGNQVARHGQVATRTVRGSRKDAQAALRAAVGQAQHVAPSKLAVAELLRQRIDAWHGRGKITGRTKEGYDVAANIAAPIGAVPVQDLAIADIERCTWACVPAD